MDCCADYILSPHRPNKFALQHWLKGYKLRHVSTQNSKSQSDSQTEVSVHRCVAGAQRQGCSLWWNGSTVVWGWFLTSTAAISFMGRVLHVGVFEAAEWTTIILHSFVHFLTDYIHQPLKHLLHVDVVFGTGFKELESWKKGKVELQYTLLVYSKRVMNLMKFSRFNSHLCKDMLYIVSGFKCLTQFISQSLAIFCWYKSVILQITLIPHQNDLCIVPRVCLNLGSPKGNTHRVRKTAY